MTRTPKMFTATVDQRISRCAALITLCAWLIAAPGQLLAAAPVVGLTKVGNPIWKVGDFQLFTATAAPFPNGFLGTLDAMLPLEGPGVTTYTPHPAPYDQELSTNAAAAGFVNSNVFQQSAITFDPNAVFFMYMMLPDPGITGSSRDFASGPIVPNSLFPFTSNAKMWLDGNVVETLQDNLLLNVRNGDLPYDGQSHRAPSQAVWYPWADSAAGPLGSHELRMSVRDIGGNGWDMVAAFEVVPEPGTLIIGLAGATGLVLVRPRKKCTSNVNC
jgi:hypothetical protein